MAQMRDEMIIRVCVEGSSLGKLLGSNDVQVNVFGADPSGADYDITRVRGWANRNSKGCQQLFLKWYDSGLRYKDRDKDTKKACIIEILDVILDDTLTKDHRGTDFEKSHPLYRMFRYAEELANQIDNAYNLWTHTKESFEKMTQGARIKS